MEMYDNFAIKFWRIKTVLGVLNRPIRVWVKNEGNWRRSLWVNGQDNVVSLQIVGIFTGGLGGDEKTSETNGEATR
jgi:hypothetical protein